MGAGLRAVVLDVAPLRESRRFRWLFAGQLGASFGRQALVVAVPYQVYVLTESPLLVGLVGLAQVVPLILCSFLGGVVADAFDRHRVLVAVQLSMAATSAGLAVNAVRGDLAIIFVLVALNAGLTGLESPTRTSIIPTLLERRQLPSAFALNQTLSQTAAIAGPALGGLLIARYGTATAYVAASSGLALAALAVSGLGRSTAARSGSRVSVAAVIEGWRYLRTRPALWQAMVTDLSAMVFGLPRALFPVIGLSTLGGDAATVGLLHAGLSLGAFFGAVTTGWVKRIRRQGRVVILAMVVWGAAIACFGLARQLPVALALLAIAGAANAVSTIFRATITQAMVPDQLRGRVTSYHVAASAGGPQLGDAEAGLVAEVTTPSVSVVSGGLASIVATILIAWRGRALWEQTVEEQVNDPDTRQAPPR